MRTERLLTILLGIVMAILMLLVFIQMIVLMCQDLRSVPDYYCEETGGTMVFYECQNVFGNTPCSELKTGMWCDYKNGDSISYDDIWAKINSSQMGL